MATIATYDDYHKESVLLMSVSGEPYVLVSEQANVEIELVNDFDKQRHKNQNFGRKKFLGISFAKIDVDFIVLPDDEARFWSEIVPLFRQRGKTGNGPALDVANYQMNRAGVNAVNCVRSKIGPPSARSGRKVSLHLEEWSIGPSKPKPSTTGVEQLGLEPNGLVEQRRARDNV